MNHARFHHLIAVSSACLLAAVATATAQTPRTTGQALLKQQRMIDEQLDRQRARIAPLDDLLDWEWGGWLEYYFFDFNDGVQSQRLYQRPAFALWTHLDIDHGAHEIFARMKLTYEYFNPGDQYNRRRDWVGPNLDRGWYQIDIGRAFRLAEPSDPLQLRLKIGRQETQFGTGYVLDMPLDAITLDARLYDLRVRALLGKTIGGYPNIDRSAPVADHSARNFYGVQVSYQGLENHEPFVYAIWNDDHTAESPRDPLQDFGYDSQYFGLGSRGSLAHNFNYWAEWVYESGHSFGDGNYRRQDPIDAWGFDVGLEYLWDCPTRPRASVEYMFASGDSDRLFSATSTIGGNRGGTRDHGFAAFGYRDTGLDAAFVPSNLHIWRAGGSLAPLDRIDWLRDFEIGTNWFLYYKHHRRGALSDSTAGQFSGYVGWEMDYFLNWRVASDVSWTLRWGAFFPGDAYQDRSTRNFLLTGLTWSF